MKHWKLMAAVIVAVLLTPAYLRHRDAVDARALQAWNVAKGLWSTQTAANRDLGNVLSNAGTMGAPMKSHRELHEEVVRKTEQLIDERERKDIAAPEKQN